MIQDQNNILTTVDLSMCEDEITSLKNAGYLICHDLPGSETWEENVKRATVYIASAAVKFTHRNFKNQPNLKILLNPNTGQDHIDFSLVELLNLKFLTIKNEKQMLSRLSATSELAWGLLLNYIRNISIGMKATVEGEWPRESLMGRQIREKKVGVVGLGRLGLITAQIATGFSADVFYYDPNVSNENYTRTSLELLVRECDIIFLHVHLDDSTFHLLDGDLLTTANNKPIIINTSRANIVDEVAIIECLDANVIEAYLTDIIDGEWLSKIDKLDHKLIKYASKSNRVQITPHIGGSSYEGVKIARGHALRMLMEVVL